MASQGHPVPMDIDGEPYFVVKRSGEHAPVRFDAITDRNETLCSAAYGRALDYVARRLPQITLDVVQRFKNGMSTHDLDMLTAAVCAERSTVHQDYADLAARIFVSDLQKQTATSMVDVVDQLAAAKDPHGRPAARLSEEFVEIVRRAGAEIDRRLDFSRDYRFTCFGIQTMVRSYLLRGDGGNRGPPVERPQHTYMRVALALHVGRPDRRGHEAPEAEFRERLERAFAVYDLLSTHRLVHASPTLFNMGTHHPQGVSCYLLTVDDDLTTLLEVNRDAGMISKWAGGLGICLTPMRAEGALIKTTGGESSGIRRYVVSLNSTQLYVNQGGFRPGAFAVYVEPWHADIFTFLELGLDSAHVNAPELKYALWVPDLFMEKLVREVSATQRDATQRDGPPADIAWHLFSPDRAPGLERVYGEEFRALYDRYVEEKRYERVTTPGAIMREWARVVAQKGNPYILFKDHINRKSNLSHVRTITCSNLCVPGDTRILTDRGQLRIGDLEGQNVNVWNGAAWSAVTIARTADRAPIVRVSFDNGTVLECTPEHKFYTSKRIEIPAQALVAGTSLEKASAWPVVEGGDEFPHAYTHGLFTADGHMHRQRPAIQLYGVKRRLVNDPRFEIHPTQPGRYVNEDLKRLTVFLPSDMPPKFTVPLSAALNHRLRWLEGYCDGDGCLLRNGTSLSVQICSTELVFLRDVRLMLQTMGCDPKITHGHPEGTTTIRGVVYPRRATWRLLITGTDLWTLIRLGFAPARFDFTGGTPPNRDARRFVKVVSVEHLPKQIPTYCFNERLRHRGIFEGTLTGQCAEITIPSWRDAAEPEKAEYGTCNLASIPLANFVVPDARADNPGRVRVDWPALAAAAAAALRNLDNLIDITYYPVEPCRRSNQRHRPVAIGVMGLADVFAAFKYTFGSAEALALDRALHAVIYHAAMSESSRLGAERGNFATFEGSAASLGKLQPDLWVDCGHLTAGWAEQVAETTDGYLVAADWVTLREKCKTHLRNAYVTADMPTATSSQVTGQNECFEPFTSNLYTRKTLAGEFTILNPHLLRELESAGLWTDRTRQHLVASAGSVRGLTEVPEDIRERFRTARELPQWLITYHAKARNPFLSQTQSLNYFFERVDLPEVLGVIVKGWELGLTTGSYYIHTAPAASARGAVAAAKPAAFCPLVQDGTDPATCEACSV